MPYPLKSLWLPMLLGLALCGCSSRPAITTYTVTKEVPDRMLGGILPEGGRCWFFKLSGPREELDTVTHEFAEFLKSVKVGEEGPTWTLPEGWELDDKPPNQMRLATIKVPLKSKTAELAVSFLPMKDDEGPFIVANVNRWRDQLGLSRASPQDWKAIAQVETKSGPAYFVNMSGRLKAAGSMTPPFAGGS
jgi:hypothetical protein